MRKRRTCSSIGESVKDALRIRHARLLQLKGRINMQGNMKVMRNRSDIIMWDNLNLVSPGSAMRTIEFHLSVVTCSSLSGRTKHWLNGSVRGYRGNYGFHGRRCLREGFYVLRQVANRYGHSRQRVEDEWGGVIGRITSNRFRRGSHMIKLTFQGLSGDVVA